MSTSAIASNLFSYQTQNTQMQQLQKEFQQLGEDLKSGNLSAAQQDYVTLEQLAPQSSSASPQSSNPIAQAFQQLSQDLQSGNLSAAQQDFNTIQQDFQQAAQMHGHHHHHGGGDGNSIGQLFQQLGQALQSGNLSNAQQIFSTLQQDLPQLSATSTSSTSQSSSGVSVSA